MYEQIINIALYYTVICLRLPKMNADDSDFFELRLYVVGKGRLSSNAIENLEKVCEEYLKGRYHIRIIDLKEHPELAMEDQIYATPTLLREMPKELQKLPNEVRKLIGDLSTKKNVLVALEIRNGK